jgi:pimeloyl-ACP methyl ester carboxylesterase
LGVLGGVVYFGNEWQKRSWSWDPVLERSIFAPTLGWDVPTALLAATVVLLLCALFGGALVKLMVRVTRRKGRTGELDPNVVPKPTSVRTLARRDGSQLHVSYYGPEEGTPIILTHGWGLHGAEWNCLVRELSDRFRVVVWDEPGLGKSTRPWNRDYSLENLARCLEVVLQTVEGKPAVLAGHSIGGMITLTFCRLFPAALGSRVSGLILTNTTPTDPVKTTSGGSLCTPLETPLLKPLMYLTIALSPLFWVLNWLSYRNGSAHLSTMRSSFAGTETWEQIEFATHFQVEASPAVIARGMLGMMKYDARATLAEISVPTLIVAGDRDSTTKPEASMEMQKRIPNSRLIVLSPARHLGLIEHEEAYEDHVRQFVHLAMARASAEEGLPDPQTPMAA